MMYYQTACSWSSFFKIVVVGMTMFAHTVCRIASGSFILLASPILLSSSPQKIPIFFSSRERPPGAHSRTVTSHYILSWLQQFMWDRLESGSLPATCCMIKQPSSTSQLRAVDNTHTDIIKSGRIGFDVRSSLKIPLNTRY